MGGRFETAVLTVDEPISSIEDPFSMHHINRPYELSKCEPEPLVF